MNQGLLFGTRWRLNGTDHGLVNGQRMWEIQIFRLWPRIQPMPVLHLHHRLNEYKHFPNRRKILTTEQFHYQQPLAGKPAHSQSALQLVKEKSPFLIPFISHLHLISESFMYYMWDFFRFRSVVLCCIVLLLLLWQLEWGNKIKNIKRWRRIWDDNDNNSHVKGKRFKISLIPYTFI